MSDAPEVNEPIKSRGKTIYLLPNLLTTTSLLSAFFAIIMAIHGEFTTSAIAIFFSGLMDTLDGRVARMTHTESAFGKEFDSMVDVVSFGVTPALVVYLWQLKYLHQLGWIIAFFFLASVVLRLAKFNSDETHVNEKRYFFGLPCTAAAAVIAALVWVCASILPNYHFLLASLSAILVFFLSIMMISNIKYRSFKDIDLKGGIKFKTLVLIILILAFLMLRPSYILLLVFLLYGLSGPCLKLWQICTSRLD